MNPETHKQLVQNLHDIVAHNREDEKEPEIGKYVLLVPCYGIAKYTRKEDEDESELVFITNIYKEPRKRNRTIDLSDGTHLYEYKSGGDIYWTKDKKEKFFSTYVFWKYPSDPLPDYNYMYIGRKMRTTVTSINYQYNGVVATVVDAGDKEAIIQAMNKTIRISHYNGMWQGVWDIDLLYVYS